MEENQNEKSMEITIERVPNEKDYIVRVNGRFTITTTWAETDADIKRWVHQIQKIYRGKRRRRIISLSAERSFNYSNGRSISSWDKQKNHKDDPYELLQICVENHCLLCNIDVNSVIWGEQFNPKVLKDFLHVAGATVVGVGIDKVAKRMEKHNGWVLPKLVELRDLAAQAQKAQTTTTTTTTEDVQTKTTIDFSRFSVAKLARVVLGEDMNLVKPSKIKWWAGWPGTYHHRRFLTDDMVKYATVEAFLASQMGIHLILESATTHQ